MEVKKPIFIIGVGRSGSTIFHKMMAEHPNLAWSSKLSQWFPANPELNRLLMRAIDIPGIGAVLRSLVRPKENYRFWDYWCKGFSTPCRDLFAEDVNSVNRKVHDALAKILTPKRNRMLMKITGWPRIGFLREIFPDARFIHILRDGRAVSSSLLQQPWWWGWRGSENWRWGELSDARRQLWQRYNKSFIVLAAIEWMILMDSFDAAAAGLGPDVYKVIKYEDLCADVPGVMKDAAEFCELEWTNAFAERMNRYVLRNANDKHTAELNEKQRQDLHEVLYDYLKRYGYK